MKRYWKFNQPDFFELVEAVKELTFRVKRLEETVERHGNQIQNAFDIFSVPGVHY